MLSTVCAAYSFGQAQTVADSLLRAFGYPASDTAAVLALYDAAYELEQTRPQTALAVYQKGAAWSKTIGFDNGAGKAHNYAGIVWFSMGEIDSALANAQQSLPFFEKAGNRRSLAASLNNIGNCYNVWNNAPEAIRFYQEANAIYESLGEPANVITNLNNIGVLLTRNRNYEQAERHLKDALERSQKAKFAPGLADVNLNLGVLEEARREYGKAIAYFQNAATHYRQLGQINHLANTHSNIGWGYNLLGDYDRALTELRIAQKLLDTLHLPREKTNLAANFSALHNNRGDYRLARQIAADALAAAETVGDLTLQKRLLENLALSCERLGDFADAARHYRQWIEVERKMFDSEKNSQLLALERQYETAKKERQILAQQLQLRQKSTQNRMLLLLIFALLVAGIAVALWLRGRLRYNQRIAAQQAEIQEQRIREMRQEQKLLALDAMLNGQEEERKRIAKDLHDGLGGLLTTIKLHFNVIQEQVRQLEELKAYQRAGEMIDDACDEVRRISHNMMPSALARFGLVAALDDLAETLRATRPLDISIQAANWHEGPDETREAMLFRILQELIHNAVQHAEASKIMAHLDSNDQQITLRVEDNGKGFDPEQARKTGGLGLKSVESRVRYLGGTVQFDSSPGRGTVVIVRSGASEPRGEAHRFSAKT
ncbi:MAG: tetratricopeptide repeat protein [Saprospiraceae bacterium]|nr:tetratricopeptide repeat protein [Saprospiraceae bacterium]